VCSSDLPETADEVGVCRLSDFSGGAQRLNEVQLADGSSLPAIDLRTEWADFDLINTTRAPGTFWTAKLKVTEGSCATSYAVTGFYPMVTCAVLDDSGEVRVDQNGVPVTDDGACDPVANPAEGRVTGSGIGPEFKPRCRADVLDWAGRPVCVPTITAADLKEPPR
jgi:hypothetical protein